VPLAGCIPWAGSRLAASGAGVSHPGYTRDVSLLTLHSPQAGGGEPEGGKQEEGRSGGAGLVSEEPGGGDGLVSGELGERFGLPHRHAPVAQLDPPRAIETAERDVDALPRAAKQPGAIRDTHPQSAAIGTRWMAVCRPRGIRQPRTSFLLI
jgi:hypothetical protein